MRVWMQPEPNAVAHLTSEEYTRFILRIQRKFGWNGDNLSTVDAGVLEEWSHYRTTALAEGGVKVEVYRRTAK